MAAWRSSRPSQTLKEFFLTHTLILDKIGPVKVTHRAVSSKTPSSSLEDERGEIGDDVFDLS